MLLNSNTTSPAFTPHSSLPATNSIAFSGSHGFLKISSTPLPAPGYSSVTLIVSVIPYTSSSTSFESAPPTSIRLCPANSSSVISASVLITGIFPVRWNRFSTIASAPSISILLALFPITMITSFSNSSG